MNLFCALKVGLTEGLQSWSQVHTTGLSAELWYQVPCGPGIRTGSQVWDWFWRNKYLTSRLFRAHLLKLAHSNPILPPYSRNMLRVRIPPPPTMSRRYGAHRYKPGRYIWSKKQAIWRGAQRLRHIMTGVLRKNQGFGQETKTWATRIAYNTVARLYNITHICIKSSCVNFVRIHNLPQKFQREIFPRSNLKNHLVATAHISKCLEF